MYYQQNPLDDAKQFFSQKSILNRLIVINLIVFLLVNIVNLFLHLFEIKLSPMGMPEASSITSFFSVPANTELLLLRPWTIFTYMFLQEDIWHIFFNMVLLYFGGRIFLEYLDERKLLSTYLVGGLFGAAFYIMAFNVFPVFNESLPLSMALGSSASVLAIFVAISAYVPEYSVNLIFFGRVKLKYLAIIIVLLDVLNISKSNPGGHIAHLGGALWGYLYVSQMKLGRNFTMNLRWLNLKNIFGKFTSSKKKPEYNPVNGNGRPLNDEEYNAIKNQNQKRIDRILEKISKSGYGSLSKAEKEFLFSSSNKK